MMLSNEPESNSLVLSIHVCTCRDVWERRGGKKGEKQKRSTLVRKGEREGRKEREGGRHTAIVVIVFDSSKRDEVGACAVTVRQNGSGLHI